MIDSWVESYSNFVKILKDSTPTTKWDSKIIIFCKIWVIHARNTFSRKADKRNPECDWVTETNGTATGAEAKSEQEVVVFSMLANSSYGAIW